MSGGVIFNRRIDQVFAAQPHFLSHRCTRHKQTIADCATFGYCWAKM
jgi:hypothetical protein